MKISQRFGIRASQFELDFVDIDTDRDLPLFIDPFFMGTREDSFSTSAYRTLRNFFQTLVGYIRDGELDVARRMFNFLHEPNETCLGLSSGAPRGNAIGSVDGLKLFNSIAQSRAVATGLVEDIEDFKLFIDGIDKDKISDLTTNVIRQHLVKYTQSQCALWNIPIQDNVQTGYFWNPVTRSWMNSFDSILIVDGRKILLTPKSVVSYSKKYTPQTYHSKFVLEFLRHEHLMTNSFLVQHRSNGTPFVTKKSLQENVAPYSKDFLVGFTEAHPNVFREFKNWIRDTARPISNEQLSEDDAFVVAEYLIDRLSEVPRGNAAASEYHRLVVGVLEFLFYPDMVSPVVEQEIHEGRKRIDLTFDNAARDGFFFRLHNIHNTPCQFLFVECKNYTKDVANPELDQLAGRFSINRGRFGLLLFRSVDNMDALLARCRDTYTDQRGTILPLSDEDLITMLRAVRQRNARPYENLLSTRLRQIALG